MQFILPYRSIRNGTSHIFFRHRLASIKHVSARLPVFLTSPTPPRGLLPVGKDVLKFTAAPN